MVWLGFQVMKGFQYDLEAGSVYTADPAVGGLTRSGRTTMTQHLQICGYELSDVVMDRRYGLG